MSILPVSTARVSTLIRGQLAVQQISATEAQMLDVQNEISTGKKVNAVSDDPSSAATIEQLQKTLDARTGVCQ